MSSEEKLLTQEVPGYHHDDNPDHQNVLHQTKEISIQNLPHYYIAADQVSDTKPILTDRAKIQLFESMLMHILKHHLSSENLKECYKIPKIWRSKLDLGEIEILLNNSIKLGRVISAKMLAKLRGKKLSSEEKNSLIISCINNGWYYASPHKKELRRTVLNLRLIPILKFSEKIAVYEICKKEIGKKQANIFALENPITFLTYFLTSTLNKAKEIIPSEDQIMEYSKL